MAAGEFNSTQGLRLWHQVSRSLVSDGRRDLSQRQLAVLLEVYLAAPPHTVRGLAAKLGVTKPVITRALDTMGANQLVARRRDPEDRRNVLIQRTVEGSQFVEHLGDIVVSAVRDIQS